MSRSSRQPARPPACWRTSPRRSRSGVPTSPCSEATAAFASRALAGLGEGESMLDSATRWQLAAAEWPLGRLAEAERLLSSSIARGRAAGQLIIAAWAYHDLGQVQRARGRLDAAAGTYQQALEVTAPPGRPALPAA